MKSPTITLPISASDVLDNRLPAAHVLNAEKTYGNADLIRVLEITGVAGPFRAVTPWEHEDARGIRRINAGGYAALPFGDRYPPLIEFVEAYLARSQSPGLPQQAASPWRAALEQNLVSLLARFAPSHSDSRVFFSNSGAEAIETAIKFARMARPKAARIINFTGAYHGKTYAPLSLTPNAEYQDPFRPLMPGIVTVPYGDLRAFAKAVRSNGPDRIAAVFIEPVQGEAGVIIPPEGYLKGIGDICRKHGIIIVADEIQTGLGRCGEWFASIADGLEPDVIALAKPLGGGLTPIGATIARREIFGKMLAGMSCKRHSNTFGGNSLSMAVGLKSLELLVEDNLPERSRILGERGLARLTKLRDSYPKLIEAVRGRGMLMALQFRPVSPVHIPFADELIGEFSGVLALRMLHAYGVQANLSLSSKRVVRLTPALNIPEDLFDTIFERIDRAAAKNPNAPSMLTSTPPDILVNLTKFALAPHG
ncbi:MAG: aminotransferase class III-fold pyridoxal phosphate-dependent enzyme [Capsulimonadaceae bacterium]|nr:aminotransferase class III-fold pyridoxal phosphate-dependent enzyme [Capsulimonadaceae bacterium]